MLRPSLLKMSFSPEPTSYKCLLSAELGSSRVGSIQGICTFIFICLLFGAPVPLNVYLILGLGPFKCVPSFHHRPELSSLLLQSSTPFLAQNPVFSRHASDC